MVALGRVGDPRLLPSRLSCERKAHPTPRSIDSSESQLAGLGPGIIGPSVAQVETGVRELRLALSPPEFYLVITPYLGIPFAKGLLLTSSRREM